MRWAEMWVAAEKKSGVRWAARSVEMMAVLMALLMAEKWVGEMVERMAARLDEMTAVVLLA